MRNSLFRRKSISFLLSAFAACASLSACDDDSKKDKNDAECDPATYADRCDTTDNMTQYYCSSDKKINKRTCVNGCNKETGACVDVNENNCRAGSTIVWKCSEDGKTSTGCRNNAAATDNCEYGCNTTTGRCKEAPCTDGSYRCDSNNLQKCSSGTWATDQECGSLTCNADTHACEGNSNPECTDGTYQCTNNNLEFCKNQKWTLKEKCGDLECDPFLAECYDENAKECTVRCDYDDLTLITCDEDNNEIYTNCVVGCVNAECLDDACEDDTAPTCRTTKERRICDNGHYTTSACEDGTLCVDGECKASDKTDKCTWTGSVCSSDKRSVQTCTNGAASIKKCDDGYTCNANSATCEKAFTGDKIAKNTKCDSASFIPFCGAVEGSEYKVNTVECVNNVISSKGCADDRVCEVDYTENSVDCRPKTAVERLEIGQKCSNDDKFAKTPICIDGNIPAACDSSTGYLTANESYSAGCKKDGMICSVTDVEYGVDTASCFEPCPAAGLIKHTCVSAAGSIYQQQLECTDLGDGQLGYVAVAGTFKSCDITCAAGQCVDYTAEIPNAGGSCDLLPDNSSYCLNDSLLVECAEYTDDDDNEVSQIAGEKCYTYETCTTVDKVAKCRQNCKAGDPDLNTCQVFLTNEFVATSACTNVDGKYVYVDNSFSDWTKCSNGCLNGKCL